MTGRILQFPRRFLPADHLAAPARVLVLSPIRIERTDDHAERVRQNLAKLRRLTSCSLSDRDGGDVA